MNKTVINTFTDGMNKDIDKSMFSNKAYLDAHNFRIVTTKGSSTGSLETIKGNKLLHASQVIDSGQFIIGSCEIRDKIVLFTTANVTTNPSIESGASQIYYITVNLETEVQTSIIKLYDDSGSTDGSRLNFSTAYPIKTIGRYETPNIQKVYWTDGYNNLRYVNISNTLTVDGSAYPISDYMGVDKFEFLPKFVPTKPVLKNIVGGNINTGMIAYSYQLYILNGAETAFSPLSDPIHVVSDNDFSSSTKYYQGDSESINSGKGFTLEIDNAGNDGYNRLRLIRIEYTTINSTPRIIVANEIQINNIGTTVYVTDVGNTLTELTVDEFNISSTELFKCEDIETKDNRLFVANIEKSDFVLSDWDARAVRFRASDSTAYLIDSVVEDNITLSGDLSDWISTYTYYHDGINPFNDPANDGDADYQYMYQGDGETLGAEGLYIKIDFETAPMLLDTSNDDTTFYVSSPTDGADLSYKNYASPWKGGKLSWQRDEVYRLFVVFGNDRSQVSDPKWICDLRMPSLQDSGYSSLAYVDGTNINTTRLYPRVWFKSFPTNATWAQIYRVKRDRADRFVVTQGLAIPTGFDAETITCLPDQLDKALMDEGGVAIFKLVSPEINISKNISRQANDYIQHVTDFTTVSYPSIDQTDGYNRYVGKLKENTRLSYSDDDISYINEAVVVQPATVNTDYVTIDNKKYSNYYEHDDDPYSVGKGCTGLVISYSNFSWTAEDDAYTIINYKSNVYGSQYGGHTYEDRMSNISIPCSDVITTIEEYHDVSYGDTFINYFDVSTILYDLSKSAINRTISESIYVPLESSINCDLRHDSSCSHLTYSNTAATLRQEYLGSHVIGVDSNERTYDQEDDLYLYNTVYSQPVDVRYAIAFPVDKVLETKFDCMIKASNVKSNGETKDSWSMFGINEFIEVDTKYGSINALHNFNDRLYYWQNKAFGIASVNTRSLISDNNPSELVLGTGGLLDRYDYLSNYIGCMDKFSVVSSISGMYWYDRLSKSIYKHTNSIANLTKTKYMQSFMDETLDDEHIVIAHADIKNDEVLYTFYKEGENNGFTISFSEPMDAFVSFYDYVPNIYIPYKHRYLTTTSSYYSSDDVNLDYLFLHDSDIWDRCYFYALTSNDSSKYVDSTLEVLFNPEYSSTKVFDNMFYISNTFSGNTDIFSDTFNYVQFYNDFQNTGEVTLTPKDNVYRRERGWTLAIPRNIVDTDVSDNPDIFTDIDPNQLFKERMRDKYLIAYFTYHNDGVYDRFLVSNIGLKYRNSIR